MVVTINLLVFIAGCAVTSLLINIAKGMAGSENPIVSDLGVLVLLLIAGLAIGGGAWLIFGGP